MEGVVEFLAYLRSLDVHLAAENGVLNCTAPKGVLTKELKEQLREKKFSLIAILEQNAQATADAPLVRVNRDGFLDPSVEQERLWHLEQFEGSHSAHNITYCLRLTGNLDHRALQNSLKEIIRRHEVLRTNLVDVKGKLKAAVRSTFVWNVGVHSLRDVPESRQEQALLQFAVEEFDGIFDLAAAPLIRVSLVELGESDHALLIAIPQIVADSGSFAVILDELSQLYPAFCENKLSPLAELSIQYLDYAQWNRQHLQSNVMQTQLAFWKQQLHGPLPVMELPVDRPRPQALSFRAKRAYQLLSAEVLISVRKFSTAENVTLFTALLTAYEIMLHRYTREADIVVGSAVAGRTRPELEKLVGLFIKTLPLRTHLSENPTVRELLARVRETTQSVFSHQDVSFSDLIELTHGAQNLNRSQLFQVVFNLQEFPLRNVELPGLTAVQTESKIGTTRYDLELEAHVKDQELQLEWKYNSDLFNDSTIARMQEHYRRLLSEIIAHPERRISELEMITEAEHNALHSAFEGVRMEYPRRQCIHDLFVDQAVRNPEALAVLFGDESLTYRELDVRSNRLANRLRSLGVGPDVLVGLCVDRSAHLAVALLAILKAGGAYVPVDPQYPPDRIAYMIEDSQAAVLITEQHLLDLLPQNVPSVICLDRDHDSLARENDLLPVSGVTPENLAYVIYTSGSTGKPKGVELTHRSVVNFLASMRAEPGLSPRDRLLAVTTLCFDIAGLEIYLPLTTGACVVIAPRAAVVDGAALARLIRDFHISVMQATPVTWRLLLDSGWTGTPGLKILCGGEAFPRELANRLLTAGAELWNLYGPTETTIWSTLHRVDQRQGSVPIGKPIANTQVYILDEYNHLVPSGVAGELLIGGDGLARGYLRRPELTAEKFVPNPFRPGEKLYRTGDLARWLPDGNLEYLQRLDHQVKLRGFRIELGEIETALEQQPAVRQAVVLVREDTPNDQRLTAYLVLQDKAAKDPKSLREILLSRLPDYMVPSQYVFLDAFPLTPNRKVDRHALPVPENNTSSSALYAPPTTETEIKVAAIWQDLLKQSRVGVNDNFFDLGGHSLLVVQLQTLIRKRFHRELSLVELFQRSTVSAIASLLDTKGANTQIGNTGIPARTGVGEPELKGIY